MILQKQIEFFDALWGGNGDLCRIICYGTTAPNKFKGFRTNREAIDFANELIKQNKYNVYHACSLFKDAKRTKENVTLTNALWVDIDFKPDGCKNLDDALNVHLPKFKDTLFELGYWILSTGHGIHLYWMSDRYLTPDEWLQCANHLHNLCAKRKIPVDPARTRDIASLMRFPYSVNYKKGD